MHEMLEIIIEKLDAINQRVTAIEEKERQGANRMDTVASQFVIQDNVLIKYIGEGGNVIIPHGVKKIEKHAFKHCRNVTSVVIPDSVTEIGQSAFRECYNLTDVMIPNSVVKIQGSAFNSCFSLTMVHLPDSIESLGIGVFSKCVYLTSVNIPSNKKLKIIRSQMFEYCFDLRHVHIPGGIKTIEYSAFRGCNNLLNIFIPPSVDSIASSAFLHTTNAWHWDSKDVENTILTIRALPSSYAKSFAIKNNYKFEEAKY